MADEPTPPSEETTDAAEAPAPRGPGIGLVIGGLAGGLAIGAAAGVFLLGPMVSRASGYAPRPDSAAHAAGEEKKEGDVPPATLHTIDNLVLNPAGSGGTRFLLCSVAIELADEKFAPLLTARDPEVRDAILRVLGGKTVDELTDTAQRESLKAEVRAALDALFKKQGAVARLYFPSFVIQ